MVILKEKPLQAMANSYQTPVVLSDVQVFYLYDSEVIFLLLKYFQGK